MFKLGERVQIITDEELEEGTDDWQERAGEPGVIAEDDELKALGHVEGAKDSGPFGRPGVHYGVLFDGCDVIEIVPEDWLEAGI
jgi:hypothetical protein